MKIKCTSKRRFKKILSKMIPYVLGDLLMHEILAHERYDCGIKIYKGMSIKYVNKVWLKHNTHGIYITQKNSFFY